MTCQTNYLVVLHMATAGKQDEDLGSDESQVVLLVYMVYDVFNNKIVAVQQNYVRPNYEEYNDNVLSDDCKQSTGLTEDVIKNAQPLEVVLDEMERFFEAKGIHPESGGSSIRLCVDGPQPLRLVLHPEAHKKQLLLKRFFNEYFDIRKEFQKLHKRPSTSIKDMMEYLTLEEDGSIDLGMRRVHDMASIVRRLISSGHQFTDCEKIKDRLEPGICNKGDYVDNETVIRARGLPWQSSDADIAKFFTGLNIAKGGVALCLSQQGRRNGEALIRFDSKESRDLALRKHKHHLGNRYIEVYKATGTDFLNVAGGSNSEAQTFLSRGAQSIIRMRGLPYTATADQVLQFFKNGENSVEVLDGKDGILFVHQADGRATGDAFVLFGTDDEANVGLTKHRELIGTRYIELFKSTTAEVQQVLNRTMETHQPSKGIHHPQNLDFLPFPILPQAPPHLPSQVPPPMMAGHGGARDCIRLRGLPYEASVTDILAFLGDHSKNIIYQGVHMVYGVHGHPTGDAFIQMDTELAAESASINKHMKYMPSANPVQKKRYIEVFQCSSADMSIVLTTGQTDLPIIPNIPNMPTNIPPNLSAIHTNTIPPGAMQSGMHSPLNLTPPSLQHSPTHGSPTSVPSSSPLTIPFNVQQRAPLFSPASHGPLNPAFSINHAQLQTSSMPPTQTVQQPNQALQQHLIQQQHQLFAAQLAQQQLFCQQGGLTAGQLVGANRGAMMGQPPILYYYPSPPISPQTYFNPAASSAPAGQS